MAKSWSGLFFLGADLRSMGDKHKNKSETPSWPESNEYGDALSDVLKDQALRKERRGVAAPGSGRARLHPVLPPVLALVSIWLWAFPPSVLLPETPTIAPANQEAGLRMEMFMQFINIQRYVAENGHLPHDLEDVGDGPDEVLYSLETGNTFRLTGTVGGITVDFTSDDPVEDLLGDAVAIVSGTVSPPSGGAPAI